MFKLEDGTEVWVPKSRTRLAPGGFETEAWIAAKVVEKMKSSGTTAGNGNKPPRARGRGREGVKLLERQNAILEDILAALTGKVVGDDEGVGDDGKVDE